MTEATAPPSPAHGIDAWPFGPATGLPRPASLPDGQPWPRIRVVTAADDGADLSGTVASVLRQGYPEARHDVLARRTGGAAFAELLTDPGIDHLLWLRAGDLLAPGALTALALEAALTGASAVAGLRVLFDDAVRALDAPAAAEASVGMPFTGGEILWSRAALDAGTRTGPDGMPDAAAWSALPEDHRARIGRPVLLQRLTATPRPQPAGLSIVSLTGTGTQGGAGVAQRRLAEALALAGHRVTRHRAERRVPRRAEWTDDLPAGRGGDRAAGPDLVLAGNLHGATRSLDVVGRLARRRAGRAGAARPVPAHRALRHPRDCAPRRTIGCDAACPGPDEYPQLAPGRIAGMHAASARSWPGPDGPVAARQFRLDPARAAGPRAARHRGGADPAGLPDRRVPAGRPRSPAPPARPAGRRRADPGLGGDRRRARQGLSGPAGRAPGRGAAGRRLRGDRPPRRSGPARRRRTCSRRG